MKKNICFVVAVSLLLSMSLCSGCTKCSKSSDEDWWLGTFSNDSISLIINPNGVCRIITPSINIGAECVWDVDKNVLLVTDENGSLHLFKRDNDKLISPEGGRLDKRE